MKRVLCGADTLVREMPEPRMAEAKPNAILASIVRSFAVFVATLREIFDESAYQRFLDRSQLQSSAGSYAMFCQETEQARSRRPKCC
jgi:hypothetical protein